MPDNALIQRFILQNDFQAFDSLYQKYFDKFWKYIYFRVQNQHIAEDINSQVWVKILENLQSNKFRSTHENSFVVLAYIIIKSLINDHYRSSSKSPTLNIPINDDGTQFDSMSTEDIEEDVYTTIDSQIFSKNIQEALEMLPEQQRTTIEMRYISELKNKEIAEILGVSEKTVASNIVRGLRNLKEIFQKKQ